jgi:hypothetical protein
MDRPIPGMAGRQWLFEKVTNLDRADCPFASAYDLFRLFIADLAQPRSCSEAGAV